MLVDDVQKFFASLCAMAERRFDAEEYRQVLASLTKKGHIHVKTRDTYFYTANIFKLIKEVDRPTHKYRITTLCEKICGVKDDISKKKTYRRYLKGLILSNDDKGPLFKRFLEYTDVSRELQDIQKEFKEVPAKTLIAFCVEAGLAVSYGGVVKSGPTKTFVSIPEFYSALTRAYSDIQDKSTRTAPLIYASIDTLRDAVSLDLGLDSPELFDAYLEKTVNSKVGNAIYLHGAPPQSESDFRGFRYHKRRYAYLSLRLSS